MSEKHPECPLYNPLNCKEYYNPKLCAFVRKDKVCLKKKETKAQTQEKKLMLKHITGVPKPLFSFVRSPSLTL